MGTSDYLPDIYARCPRASADISGKSLVPMLQLSHIYRQLDVFKLLLESVS